jgi:PHD/YefM family antitoxin component YafN of YafNO toxin-antitoxin module
MQAFKRYRPLSYLQTNAADVARELAEESGAVVITEDGVPSFVCLSFDEFYRMQETNALVKLVKIGEHEIKQGQYKTLAEARKELDQRFVKTGKVQGQQE